MKEEITIIDNYNDLSLGDYQEIFKLCKDESLEELDRQVKIMSILTGKSEDFLLDMPIMDYKSLASKLSFLQEGIPPKELQRAENYLVCGFDLIPVKDIRKVTTAQYIDFLSFHQAGMEEHFVEILSCLLVPRGKKYNQDYDILAVQDAIRTGLNVHDGLSLYGFFIVSCSESIKDILTYSLQEAKQIPDQKKREEVMRQIQEQISLLGRNGDGSQM